MAHIFDYTKKIWNFGMIVKTGDTKVYSTFSTHEAGLCKYNGSVRNTFPLSNDPFHPLPGNVVVRWDEKLIKLYTLLLGNGTWNKGWSTKQLPSRSLHFLGFFVVCHFEWIGRKEWNFSILRKYRYWFCLVKRKYHIKLCDEKILKIYPPNL